MAEFYAGKRDASVLPALKKRGAPMYVLESTDTFDEATGQVTEDTSPKRTLVYGLLLSTKKQERDGDLASRIVKKIMLSATGLSALSPAHTLLIGTEEHEIMEVEPFAPGGVTLFYDVKVAL